MAIVDTTNCIIMAAVENDSFIVEVFIDSAKFMVMDSIETLSSCPPLTNDIIMALLKLLTLL